MGLTERANSEFATGRQRQPDSTHGDRFAAYGQETETADNTVSHRQYSDAGGGLVHFLGDE
jgi:hypothetical protein